MLQLDQVRDATARYLDVDKAVAAGYVDIGLFMPKMGWHYMKEKLVDARFDAAQPELLVYADDPCGGKRKLVAVEYAVPLALVEARAGWLHRPRRRMGCQPDVPALDAACLAVRVQPGRRVRAFQSAREIR